MFSRLAEIAPVDITPLAVRSWVSAVGHLFIIFVLHMSGYSFRLSGSTRFSIGMGWLPLPSVMDPPVIPMEHPIHSIFI